jgi:signal transduction histidine kinase
VIELALLLALGTIAVGGIAALLLRQLPALRLQLAGLALLAVLLPLAGVFASGWVMFEMHADTKVLAVSSAAALSSVLAALILARWIRAPLDRLRSASARLAGGDLSSRAVERGPAELVEVAHAFNVMADSIERLFEARRELVAWASHDLRTPLASMRAMIEAVDDGLAEPGEYMAALGDQVLTLSSLVDDLFELARIDAGVLTHQIQQADLQRVIGSCVRGFAAEARAKGISLEARNATGVPSVRCAPDQVQRILHNLLTNAIRHTPPDGAVAIVVSPDERDVTIAVEDTGEGLSDEAAARMFDRFWRADSARTSTGSGLGLAIARSLVEAHGGRIWAENRPAGGARIAFTLPTASA